MVPPLQTQIVVLLAGNGISQHMANQAQKYSRLRQCSVQNNTGIEEGFK